MDTHGQSHGVEDAIIETWQQRSLLEYSSVSLLGSESSTAVFWGFSQAPSTDPQSGKFHG
jgi:hypothetical protein